MGVETWTGEKKCPSCYPLFLPHHNGCFFWFLSKKYLRQISILGTNNISKSTFVMSILKVIYYLVLSYLVPFFQISYLLVLRFVFNTFWTKISNNSHCAVRRNSNYGFSRSLRPKEVNGSKSENWDLK